MRAPATYTRDATGATGTFGVDVAYFDTGPGFGVTIHFMPDTTGVKPNYKEWFSGKLVSFNRK